MSPTGKAVVTRTKTLKDLVQEARGEIQAVLPAHMNADKVIRAVRLAIAQNPDLEKCEPKTVLFAVMAAARIGLEINSPLHECSLVPFGRECTLMVEYRGYQSLARRSDEIRNIEARCVYAGDDFDYQLGTTPTIEHHPSTETDDAKITHAYAVAFDKQGKLFAFDVLRREEIEAARKVSRMASSGAWKQWYGEMARKTAVRRLAKYLPLSADMAAAIELDLRGETGTVSAAIPLIDSPETLNATAAMKTEEKVAELREHITGGSTAATPPESGQSAVAPQGAAPEAEKGGQPW